MAAFNLLSLMLVTPLVVFYALLDWPKIVAKVDSWLPRENAPQIRMLAADINNRDLGVHSRPGRRVHRSGRVLFHRPERAGSALRIAGRPADRHLQRSCRSPAGRWA